jgi:hypothetical protein
VGLDVSVYDELSKSKWERRNFFASFINFCLLLFLKYSPLPCPYKLGCLLGDTLWHWVVEQ